MLITTATYGKVHVEVYRTPAEAGGAAAKAAGDHLRTALGRQRQVRALFAAAVSQLDFLAGLAHEAGVEWSRVEAFQMDEYLGLAAGYPASFSHWLRRHLFEAVVPGRVEYMRSDSADPAGECQRYGELLTESPIDLGFFGIGENGHLAFNDPSVADFTDRKAVKVVELDARSRQQQVNDGAFPDLASVPPRAITVTIPVLIGCRRVSAVVIGSRKAAAVERTLRGPITEQCPASILRGHQDATIYVDANAYAALLAT